MPIVAGGFTQSSFRYREDDGSETTATWSATQDTDFSPAVDTIFRLRFEIKRSAGISSVTSTFYLRYSKNGGAYTDVAAQGATTDAVRYADSANITDDEATTEQLAGSGSFIAGKCDENGAATLTYPAAASDSEFEFVLEIYSGQVANGDTLDFRMYRGAGTAMNAYTLTPRSIVSVPETNAIRWYH